ncbi:MAG: hypothetical protein KJN62_04630 [Deltaproteobacteria bacterium]|nr:hypothetical protein [Deltaproteobacteria bacterium]
MKPNVKAELLILNNLDKIYTTCKGLAKSWRTKRISIAVLQHVISLSKMGEDVKLNDKFKNAYNAMLDELLKTCRGQSVAGFVSFKDLRKNIKICKKGILKWIDSQ